MASDQAKAGPHTFVRNLARFRGGAAKSAQIFAFLNSSEIA
jgi:hypothetical protein